MSFQLHPEARNWFKKVQGQDPLPTLFDVYQLCFNLGIAHGRCTHLDDGVDNFMDEFIQRYRNHQMLMVGTMLTHAMKRQGIELTDRSAVVEEIERLVDSSGMGMQLTSEGYREMNAYAAGGFNALREELEEPPSEITYLLKRFRTFLKGTDSVKI